MKSYSISTEITKIQWRLLNASRCRQHPIEYFVRVRESMGRFEYYGPLSQDNWEIKQQIKPDDICVYAKYGTTKGPCSKSIFYSQSDNISADGMYITFGFHIIAYKSFSFLIFKIEKMRKSEFLNNTSQNA